MVRLQKISSAVLLSLVLLAFGGLVWAQSAGTPPATASKGALVAEASTEFVVTAVTKQEGNPYLNVGSPRTYAIDGRQGRELTFKRGTTYTFKVEAPNHPFYISTDPVGGQKGTGEVTAGVTGSKIVSGLLTFTPAASDPNLLYYQCAAHPNMGWKVHLID